MKKISAGISIAALAVLVLSIGMSSPPQEANATEDVCKIVTFEETVDRKFTHQAVIKTDDKKYRIDADIEVGIPDESPEGCNAYEIIKFGDAEDTKTLKLHTGEDITVKFDCKEDDRCGGHYDAIDVVLVDKDEKDEDIALNLVQLPRPSSFIPIADECVDEEPFFELSDCKVETTIPKDIDKGKYNLVVEAVFDEGSTFFINEVKIKE